MTDIMTKDQRSHVMSRIRGRDTKPELAVRKMVADLGYGFHTNHGGLPGTPDIVIPMARTCIEVNGCFWHWHWHTNGRCPTPGRMPATNTEFWVTKLAANRARDRRKADRLRHLGWRVLTVWECELRHPDKVKKRIKRFIDKAARLYE